MSLPAYEALLRLKAHLETIKVANGYALDVGTVALDREVLAVGSNAPLPIITLLTQRDEFDRQVEQGDIEASEPFQHYRRLIDLEGFVDASEQGWELALETLLHDLRLALRRYPSMLRMGTPVFLPPEQNTASFTLSLSVPYTLNFSMI